MDRHSIAAHGLAATIAADGAELVSLRMADGTELIWQAGPAWPRHAPVLFPIVGRLRDDTLLLGERRYRMTQHGFARDRRFAWLERSAHACRLLLSDDEQTRAAYPFAFRLELGYAIQDSTLAVEIAVQNCGPGALPCSFGAHPAFAWPLVPGAGKDAHTITFEQPESGPVRRLSGGLLLPDAVRSPVEGNTLRLHDALFAQDALIFDHLTSRRARYTAPGAPALTLTWDGFPQLGIWSKPAEFVCIEPWHGFASPERFAGPFPDKPGLLHVPPGGSACATFSIGVSSHSDDD